MTRASPWADVHAGLSRSSDPVRLGGSPPTGPGHCRRALCFQGSDGSRAAHEWHQTVLSFGHWLISQSVTSSRLIHVQHGYQHF